MTFCPWCRGPIVSEEVTDISGRRMHGECQRAYRVSLLMGQEERARIEAGRSVVVRMTDWARGERD